MNIMSKIGRSFAKDSLSRYEKKNDKEGGQAGLMSVSIQKWHSQRMNSKDDTLDPHSPKQFSPSVYTIKVKLISIISGLLLTSLSAIILVASSFFREDIESNIQSTTNTITDVLGQKTQDQIEFLSYRGYKISKDIVHPNHTDAFEHFTGPNDSLLLVGLLNQSDPNTIGKFIVNSEFLIARGMDPKDIQDIVRDNLAGVAVSDHQEITIKNVSLGSKIPLLMFTLPPSNEPKGTSTILLIDPTNLIGAFNIDTMPGFSFFIVDQKGDVITHPDLSLILSRTNLMQLPIVSTMVTSPIDNQVLRYTYQGGSFLGSFQKLPVGAIGIISVVNEEVAYSNVLRLQRRNFLITAIILTISIIFLYYFSRTLSNPIVDLVEATKQVEGGDFAISISPKAGDEIGVLTNSFLQMSRGLQERERLKTAFGRITNKKLAEKAMAGELDLGGERKECAVFFSDLRGFTAMSEGMMPEDVVTFLNEYFKEMVGCVIQTGGVVDKFIGDAIMATWGAIESTGNDCESAINAALLMRQRVLEMNARNEGRKPHAAMGSGINFGHVISGQIGSDERMEYTVIGDAVNFASRIEALNKPFGTDILISSYAYEKVKDIFRVQRMPGIKVKGKAETQIVYAVLSRFDDSAGATTLSEVRSQLGLPMEGSDAEKEHQEEKEIKYEIVGES